MMLVALINLMKKIVSSAVIINEDSINYPLPNDNRTASNFNERLIDEVVLSLVVEMDTMILI